MQKRVYQQNIVYESSIGLPKRGLTIVPELLLWQKVDFSFSRMIS